MKWYSDEWTGPTSRDFWLLMPALGAGFGMMFSQIRLSNELLKVQMQQAQEIAALKAGTDGLAAAVSAMDEHTAQLQRTGIRVAVAGVVVVIAAAILGALVTHWLGG